MKWGAEFPRLAGPLVAATARLVGEPITRKHGSGTAPLGGGRCPVVDTWWQTERAPHDCPLPGRCDPKPGTRRSRSPASAPISSTATARPHRRCRAAATSCSTRPWPSMLRGIWGDPERYREDLLEPLRRPLLRRRRRRARRRRRLLAPRPGRRRDARRRATTSRRPKWSTPSSATRRSRRRRSSARKDGTTGNAIRAFVILRGRRRRIRRARRRAARPRRSVAIGPIAKPKTHPLHRRPTRRHTRARSYVGLSATSPRTRRSATRRRSPTHRVVEGIKERYIAVCGRAAEW